MQRAKICNFMFTKILHLTNIFISTFFFLTYEILGLPSCTLKM